MQQTAPDHGSCDVSGLLAEPCQHSSNPVTGERRHRRLLTSQPETPATASPGVTPARPVNANEHTVPAVTHREQRPPSCGTHVARSGAPNERGGRLPVDTESDNLR